MIGLTKQRMQLSLTLIVCLLALLLVAAAT